MLFANIASLAADLLRDEEAATKASLYEAGEEMMQSINAKWVIINGAVALLLAAFALGGMFLLNSPIGWLPLMLYGAMGLGYGHGLERGKCHQCDTNQNEEHAKGCVPTLSVSDEHVRKQMLPLSVISKLADTEQQRSQGYQGPVSFAGCNAGDQDDQGCGNPHHLPSVIINAVQSVRHSRSPPAVASEIGS